jgi:hypothetical protein
MKFGALILTGIALATAIAVGLVFYPWKDSSAEGSLEQATRSLAPRTGESVRADWPAEDVFRRAFWRHPAKDDRIVNAVRIETSGSDGVSRWAWFIKIHPGPALLGDLQDHSKFGLVATTSPRPHLPKDITSPEWFQETGGEIRQHPIQGMTLRYHADDNRLYVSDHGEGFAKGFGQ